MQTLDSKVKKDASNIKRRGNPTKLSIKPCTMEYFINRKMYPGLICTINPAMQQDNFCFVFALNSFGKQIIIKNNHLHLF